MIPSDPETPTPVHNETGDTPPPQPEIPLSQQAPGSAPHPIEPFWGYADLILFILLWVPSLFVAVLVVWLLTTFTHLGIPVRLFLAQLVFYALALGSLKALLFLRYGKPFWHSLGWKWLSFSSAIGSFLIGPLLAISLAIAGNAIHTPEIPLPFQQMIRNPQTLELFGVLVVILGPVCEELVFRGFMLPLFIRSWGPLLGIVFTGFLFGLAHGYEYAWSWRHVILITAAGSIFGWARYKTGSTVASAFMHATFNLTQFAAFLAQSRGSV